MDRPVAWVSLAPYARVASVAVGQTAAGRSGAGVHRQRAGACGAGCRRRVTEGSSDVELDVEGVGAGGDPEQVRQRGVAQVLEGQHTAAVGVAHGDLLVAVDPVVATGDVDRSEALPGGEARERVGVDVDAEVQHRLAHQRDAQQRVGLGRVDGDHERRVVVGRERDGHLAGAVVRPEAEVTVVVDQLEVGGDGAVVGERDGRRVRVVDEGDALDLVEGRLEVGALQGLLEVPGQALVESEHIGERGRGERERRGQLRRLADGRDRASQREHTDAQGGLVVRRKQQPGRRASARDCPEQTCHRQRALRWHDEDG